MLEKPRLEDEKIFACLSSTYGLAATGLEFLPIGYDSAAGVYRVRANGQAYFLKVKRGPVYELSLSLPRYLKAQGIEQIVAPLPTITGERWGKIDDFTLILYPFIEALEADLSDSQWIEFGAVVKRFHTLPLSPDLLSLLPKENFVPHPALSAITRQLQAEVSRRSYDHPVKKQLAEFWLDHHQEIGTILDRAEQLGRKLQGRTSNFVLCHA
ncbi:MAG: hypothetical protein HY866_00220, partial [Chloroflexi bacterium]|nr:hypothetical protein [Chloroflexota bacterium]